MQERAPCVNIDDDFQRNGNGANQRQCKTSPFDADLPVVSI